MDNGNSSHILNGSILSDSFFPRFTVNQSVIAIFIINTTKSYHPYLTQNRPQYETQNCPLGEESKDEDEVVASALAVVHYHFLPRVVIRMPKIRSRITNHGKQLLVVHKRCQQFDQNQRHGYNVARHVDGILIMGEKLERSDPSLLITVFDNFVQNSLHKATNSFSHATIQGSVSYIRFYQLCITLQRLHRDFELTLKLPQEKYKSLASVATAKNIVNNV